MEKKKVQDNENVDQQLQLVEKVIGIVRHEDNKPENYKFLVKWLISQLKLISYPYEEATWQSFQDLNGSNEALRALPIRTVTSGVGLEQIFYDVCDMN